MNFDFDDFVDAGNGIGNVLWIICGGLLFAIVYWITAIAYCLTIIGIPIGIQLFKLGKFVLMPFGHTLEENDSGLGFGCLNVFLNIFWFFFGGLELFLAHLLIGLILCITVVGIPFGVQHFKLGIAALFPFGKSVEGY